MPDGSGPIIIPPETVSGFAPLEVQSANAPKDYAIVIGFAGGGGTAQAAELALGRHPDAAINHWPTAIAVHETNYPDAEHHCADMMETDPRSVCPGREIGLLWLSPDCRHFSVAKGGTPVSARVRGLAWCAIPWLKMRRPRVFMLENVGEFRTWGPVKERVNPKTGKLEMYPDPDRVGQTYERWKRRIERMGYVCEVRPASCAADFGDPTIRKRLIFIARCDDEPIVWPAATHGQRDSQAVKDGTLKPYASAASIIDWNRKAHSIFLEPLEAKALRLKRPLQDATLSRIAKGLWRYTFASAEPFIVHLTHHGGERTHGVGGLMPTVTGAHRGELALVTPVITGCGGRMAQSAPVDPAGPYNGITTKNDSCLAAAHMVRTDMSGAKFAGANSSHDPLRTNTSGGGLAIASATMVPHYGEREGQQPRSRDPGEPSSTIASQESLAVAFLQKMSENGIGSDPNDPLWAAMAGAPRHYLVAAHMEQANTGMVGHDARDGVPTIVQRGTTQRLVTAQLSQLRGTNRGKGNPADPAGSLTASGTHQAVVEGVIAPSIQSYYSSGSGLVGHDAADPAPTVTVQDRLALTEARLSEYGSPRAVALAAFLERFYGALTEEDVADPLRSAESRARWGIVLVPVGDGQVEPWQIVDICMRMLDPDTELKAAMGWRPDYILTRTADGKPVTKTEVTKLIGNGVCRNWAAAHIAANCPFLIMPEAA